jgi:O-antigen ligase
MNEYRGVSDWISVHNAFLQYAVDLGVPGLLLFLWLYVMCLRSARAVERRSAREPALGDLAHLAAGVQIALVAFGVAAFFHPIAYQFYFFAIGGMAVALKRAYVTASQAAAPAESQES